MSKTPVKVAVTGAAGQICYSLLFRIASGALLGPDQPVELRLLEITPALKALAGRRHGAGRLRVPAAEQGARSATTPTRCSDGVNLAMLVGARPRTAGMERGDLLSANGAIFTAQGKALNAVAADDIKRSGDRQPGQHQRPDRHEQRPLTSPRSGSTRSPASTTTGRSPQLAAERLGVAVTSRSSHMTIWGNHSATQYPDIFHAEVDGKNAAELVNDQAWIADTFIPTVAKRGAAIIEARARPRRPRRPTPPSSACTTGHWARRPATGPRWPSCPMAPTASRRA